MARKRPALLSSIQLILKPWLGLFLATLLLTLGISAGRLGMASAHMPVPIANRNPQQLVEGGRLSAEAGRLPEAIQQLQQAVKQFEISKNQPENLAITLTNLGRLQLRAGQPKAALSSWQQATQIYSQLGDTAAVARSQVHQAQALQAQGLYPRACELAIQAVGFSQQGSFCQDAEITQAILDANKLQSTTLQAIPQTIKAEGYRTLGTVLRAVGRLQESALVLGRFQDSATRLSLANTLRAQGDLVRDRLSTPNYDYMPWRLPEPFVVPGEREARTREEGDRYVEALTFYKQSDQLYQQILASSDRLSSVDRTKAQLNDLALRLAVADLGVSQIDRGIDELMASIRVSELPLGRDRVYGQINLAKSMAFALQQQASRKNTAKEPWLKVNALLGSALADAREMGDRPAESYVLGNQAGLYEYFAWLNQQKADLNSEKAWHSQAKKLTQQALKIAQLENVPEITYQWQWQLGRLLEQEISSYEHEQGQGQGKQNSKLVSQAKDSAIAHYTDAVKLLKAVRGDLRSINKDVQFSFRDNVEPVYRGLVDLRLQPEADGQPSQENLEKAIQEIDALQVAELESFLRCDLSNRTRFNQQTKDRDTTAAKIYPIILKNRVAVIFDIPGEKEKGYSEEIIDQKEVEATLYELRADLSDPANTPKVLINAKRVYQWLFRDLESALQKKSNIETLVFVLDGALRNIPMGVLHDGQEYLIEKKYAIATAPSLSLFQPRENHQKFNFFLGGVDLYQNLENQEFMALEEVKRELEQVAGQGKTKSFLFNEEFTKENIEHQLKQKSFSAIHWKTHGKFSSDPDQTFIVAYDELIKAKEINRLLQLVSSRGTQPLEILVLSACSTAEGDSRAVLGLAGIAVQTGARSTISTLWVAQDKPTTLLSERFYRELAKPGMTKAKALKNAQLALINDLEAAPHIWAPYTLLGNWL